MQILLEQYDDLLTISDVCKILRIGRNKAYELIRNNEIKHFHVGKSLKIPKVYLIEYIHESINRRCFK